MKLPLQKIRHTLGIQDQGLIEILKGSSVSLFMKVAGLGCGQLFAFVVARLLGADAFGSFSLALSLLTIFSILGTVGLDTGLLRFVAADAAVGDKRRINSTYLCALTIVLPTAMVITSFSFYYADWIAINIFNKPGLGYYFKIASFGILPFTLIKINSQGLRGFKEITKYTFLNFVGRYLFGLILLFPFYYLVISDNSAVIISFTVGLGIIALISFYWIFLRIDLRDININKGRYKGILLVSLPLMLASSLQFLKGWIDTLMLGYFMENSDIGIYNISLKLAGLISLFLIAVNIIAAPKFAEFYGQDDRVGLNRTVKQATKLIFFCALPMFIMIVSFPKLVLSIFGPEFRAGSEALTILAIGYLVSSMAGSVGYIMQMTGKQIAFQNITLLTAIIGIGLNYLLIPTWGINGAAVSTMIGTAFWNISCALYLKFQYNLKTYYNPLADIIKWIRS